MTDPTPAEETPVEPEAPEEAATSPAATAEAAAEEAPAEEAAAEEPAAEEPEAAPAPVVPGRPVNSKNPVWGVGRRKSSSARVRIFPGAGAIMVNGKPHTVYFCSEADRMTVEAPLRAAGVRDEYEVRVRAEGGGTTGQAGAVAHGIARAVMKHQPSTERSLRDGGFLTRDARVKERKKYGRRGARRGFQFSKR